jgi:hypothetical protein
MTPDEVGYLVARISSFDRRKIDPMQVAAWATVLEKVPYGFGVKAVQRHFADNPGVYLEVGHIIQGARKIFDEEKREKVKAVQRNSDEIRAAALERKAADAGTVVATPDQAERYGKGLLDAVMAAVAKAPRMKNGMLPKGAGVAAANRALKAYRELHGPAPVVDSHGMRCGNAQCLCTHQAPCSGGWIAVDESDPAAAVAPCPICKPRVDTILTNAKGDRRLGLALVREQGKDKEDKGDKW